jgi:hypothetical protein
MDRKFWRWVLYRWLIMSVMVVVIVSITGTVLFYLDYINHIPRNDKDVFYAVVLYSVMLIFFIGLYIYFIRLVFIEPSILNSRKMKYILKESTTKQKIKYWLCLFLGAFYAAMMNVLVYVMIFSMVVGLRILEYLKFIFIGFIFILLCSLLPLIRRKITQWLSFIQFKDSGSGLKPA